MHIDQCSDCNFAASTIKRSHSTVCCLGAVWAWTGESPPACLCAWLSSTNSQGNQSGTSFCSVTSNPFFRAWKRYVRCSESAIEQCDRRTVYFVCQVMSVFSHFYGPVICGEDIKWVKSNTTSCKVRVLLFFFRKDFLGSRMQPDPKPLMFSSEHIYFSGRQTVPIFLPRTMTQQSCVDLILTGFC